MSRRNSDRRQAGQHPDEADRGPTRELGADARGSHRRPAHVQHALGRVDERHVALLCGSESEHRASRRTRLEIGSSPCSSVIGSLPNQVRERPRRAFGRGLLPEDRHRSAISRDVAGEWPRASRQTSRSIQRESPVNWFSAQSSSGMRARRLRTRSSSRRPASGPRSPATPPGNGRVQGGGQIGLSSRCP